MTLTKDEILGKTWENAVTTGNTSHADDIESARRNLQPVRVLSLDGGGMRGLFQASVLKRLRDRIRVELGDPSVELHNLFDIIAGTSTGGILACATVTKCGELNVSPDRAAALEDFYRSLGRQVFRPTSVWRVARKILRPKFGASSLEEHLSRQLGEGRLSDVECRLLVSAYDVKRRRTYWFDSGKTKANSSLTNLSNAATPTSNPFLWHVARATSAAPSFFTAARFDDLGHSGHWVDGGVGANNPLLKSTAEGLVAFQQRRNSLFSTQRAAAADLPDKIVVVRIGNGVSVPRRLPTRWLQGLLPWALFAPSLLMHASATASMDLADSLEPGLLEITSNNEVRRLVSLHQLEPPPDYDPTQLDDASDTALEALEDAATRACEPSPGRTMTAFQLAVRAVARSYASVP